MPLTPIQRWFLDAEPANPAHNNQSVLVELTRPVDEEVLRQAIDAVVAHHDALRMRFERIDGQWTQYNAPVEPGSVLTVVSTSDGASMEGVADEAQASFDLARPPQLRAILFDLGAEANPRLFLAAHHLVVDAVSWGILLEDLDRAYQQIATGEKADLGAKTTSFRDWAHRLREFTEAGGLDDEREHWTRELPGCAIPLDRAEEHLVPPEAVSVELGPEDTDALLHQAPGAYRTRINDVLLSALARAVSAWTGENSVAIDLEGHGREEILDGVDLSRTVGWFTTLFPVTLEIDPAAGPRALVKSVRRQLRAVPGNGFGYGALRYFRFPELARNAPAIAFNYLGQGAGSASSALYQAAHPPIGREQDPANRPAHLLEVVGGAWHGRLEFTWYYRPDLHDRATVERVAADFAEALRRIAADCRGEDS